MKTHIHRKSRLRLAPRTTTKLRMSLKQKIIIGTAIFSFASFIVLFVFNNLSTSTDSYAGMNACYIPKANYSLNFDGKNNYVNIGNVDFKLKKKFTVCAWVKWNIDPQTGNAWSNIISMNSSKKPDVGQFWIQHNYNNSSFEFAVSTSKGRKIVFSTTTPESNIWYHVAGVYDGKNISIYVNGMLENSTSQSEDITELKSDYELTFGEWACYNGSRRFNGEIDEVAIFSKALSENNIRDIMCVNANTNSSNLKGYWNFNESDANAAIDLSGNNYTGFISGATHKLSGAPNGIKSDWICNSNIKNISLNDMNGESILIDSITILNKSALKGIFVYYTDTNEIFETNAIDVRKKAWGVFLNSTSPVNYRVTYNYNLDNSITNENDLCLKNKAQNDSLNCFDSKTKLDVNLKTLTTSYTNRMEFKLLQKKNGSLPVTFLDVSVTKNGNSLKINWSTASEKNNDYFTIERSNDASNFDAIGSVDGAGNSITTRFYSYSDNAPLNGENYYRIRQTDFDGKNATSKIVSLRSNKSSETNETADLNVFPNPFQNKLSINLITDFDAEITIKIANQLGQTLVNKNFSCENGTNYFDINSLNFLKTGTYYFIIEKNDEILKTIKILKM